jgi:hypothetical protein
MNERSRYATGRDLPPRESSFSSDKKANPLDGAHGGKRTRTTVTEDFAASRIETPEPGKLPC